jgi:hypothetical protein
MSSSSSSSSSRCELSVTVEVQTSTPVSSLIISHCIRQYITQVHFKSSMTGSALRWCPMHSSHGFKVQLLLYSRVGFENVLEAAQRVFIATDLEHALEQECKQRMHVNVSFECKRRVAHKKEPSLKKRILDNNKTVLQSQKKKQKVYEVERILSWRYNETLQRPEYLVRWKNYDASHDTYETSSNLCKGAAEVLRRFLTTRRVLKPTLLRI